MRAAMMALVLSSLACSHEEPEPAPRCGPSLVEVDETCVPRFDACGDAQVPIAGGGCASVGVPKDGCAEGFRHESGGCVPLLPSTPCAPGELAIPGETTCRALADCGEGTFGSIPDDPGTIHVDGAALGAAPDGSRSRPFKTIQAALDAASATRSTIAVAAGSYAENLVVSRAVKVVGRCPELVEVRGASTSDPTVTLAGAAELRTIAITGAAIGVAVVDTKAAVLDRVWVHDTAYIGVAALYRARATELVVRDSLIERAHEAGIASTGAVVSIEASVIRDTTSARPSVPAGFGVSALASTTASKQGATVSVRRSVVERSSLVSLSVVGSRLSLEGSVVRDTLTRTDSKSGGVALKATPGSSGAPEIRVVGSVLERSRDFGVEVLDGTTTFERSVIRSVLPDQPGATGGGLGVRGGELTLLDSLVEDTRGAGLIVAGNARIEGTIVRRVQPLAAAGTGELGVGVLVLPPRTNEPGPEVSLKRCLIDDTRTAGVLAFGSTLAIAASRIRDTHGTSNGVFGDGVVLIATATDTGGVLPAHATIDSTEVARSARAGIATFASPVSIVSTRVDCAALDLVMVPTFVDAKGRTVAADATIGDLGGNTCGCGGAPVACHVGAASLAPMAATPPDGW